MGSRRRRIAVITPFLDKQHGTERCVIEQLNRLATTTKSTSTASGWRISSQAKSSGTRWAISPARIVLRYLWFFAANHFYRWRDRRFRNLHFDLVFSPGVNCLDADVIVAHIITGVFLQDIQHSLHFRNTPLRSWLRLLHRRLFYRIVITLEKLLTLARICTWWYSPTSWRGTCRGLAENPSGCSRSTTPWIPRNFRRRCAFFARGSPALAGAARG
jgi:hypothetical protein